MTTVRPASPKDAPASLARTSASASARSSVTSTPLPGGQAVGLHDVGRRQRAEELEGRLGVVEGAVARGGHAGRQRQLLHLRLRALEPGAVGAGAEHELARRPQPVGEPVDERLLRSDHEQVGVELLGRRGHRAGDAGVARRDDDLGRARQHMGQARLPPPGSHHDAPLIGRTSDQDGELAVTTTRELDVLVAAGTDAEEADRARRPARSRKAT